MINLFVSLNLWLKVIKMFYVLESVESSHLDISHTLIVGENVTLRFQSQVWSRFQGRFSGVVTLHKVVTFPPPSA